MEEITISIELKSHFLRLYQIALSDGEFSALEVKMLYEFAKERGVSKDHLDKILLHANESIELIPEGVAQKIEYLCDFASMIWVDNVATNDERSMLEKYIKSFGFLDENIVPLATFLLDAVKAGKTKQEIFNELNN